MKKNIKKFASLMLALVMAIGLAAPAFAAPADVEPNTFDVEFTIDIQGAKTAHTVKVTEGQSVYDVLESQLKTQLNPQWSKYGDAYILESMAGKGTVAATPEQAEEEGIEPEAWSTLNPGYGLDSVTEKDGKPLYNYVYAGFDWTYTVNGEAPWEGYNPDGTKHQLYMNECVLKANDKVELTYSIVTSEWSTTNPISTVYPYC